MLLPRIVRVKDLIEAQTGLPPAQMVHGYYRRLGMALLDERARYRAGITTLEGWEDERAQLRQRLLTAIGTFPEREPAQAQILGEVACDGFTLQKLLFLSHPGSWVPANLYLPAQAPAPFPCIVMPPGHSQTGKEAYLEIAAYFALNGYAVLTLDFLGEGERQLGGTPETPCLFASDAHNMQSMKMALYGLSLNWFMLYDLQRAVDYLATRPDIDLSRLAMTGASGGGTATFYGTALDERIAVSAPATAVNSLHAFFQAGDAEQSFFDHARLGLDQPDIGSFLIAPRPCLIVANTQDIWPLEGTQYVLQEARRFYELHGVGEKIDIIVRDGEHGWSPPEYAGILAWFNRWLGYNPDSVSWEEAEARLQLKSIDCRVTGSGNVFWEGCRTPDDTVSVHVAANPTIRDAEAYLADLMKEVMPEKVPWEEIDRYRIGELEGRRIVFSPDDGLLLPAEVLIPPQSHGVALLLDEMSRLEAIDWQIETAQRGLAVIRPDLRGFGDTTPEESWPDWENWYRMLYNGKRYTLYATAQLCGHHLILDRARDTLAALHAARAMNLHGPLTLWGRRSCALVALFAAITWREIAEVVLEHAPTSYREMLACDLPPYTHDYLIVGLLQAGLEIPDICRRVAAKVTFRDPCTGM